MSNEASHQQHVRSQEETSVDERLGNLSGQDTHSADDARPDEEDASVWQLHGQTSQAEDANGDDLRGGDAQHHDEAGGYSEDFRQSQDLHHGDPELDVVEDTSEVEPKRSFALIGGVAAGSLLIAGMIGTVVYSKFMSHDEPTQAVIGSGPVRQAQRTVMDPPVRSSIPMEEPVEIKLRDSVPRAMPSLPELVDSEPRLAQRGADASSEPLRLASVPISADQKMEAIAEAVVSLRADVAQIKASIAEGQSSNTDIATKLDTVLAQTASLAQTKPGVAPAASRAPARAVTSSNATSVASNQAARQTPAKPPVDKKVSPIAGLWVKGTYPTTGGPTEIAWVMNSSDQLEQVVRVNSEIRGAKVIGFEGMRVRTNLGMINPR